MCSMRRNKQQQKQQQQQQDQVNKKPSTMWSSWLAFTGCMLLILASFAINEISANSDNTLQQQQQSLSSIIVGETSDQITTNSQPLVELASSIIELDNLNSNDDFKQQQAASSSNITNTDHQMLLLHDLNKSSAVNDQQQQGDTSVKHRQQSPKKKKTANQQHNRNGGRNGRQYDSAQANYGQQLELGYGNQQIGTGLNTGAYPSTTGYNTMDSHPAGYPSMHSSSAYSSASHPYYGSSMAATSPSWSSSFPLLSSGFGISEIACVAVAVVIGAIVLGGPFILLYLFMMNQMNGGLGQPGGQQGAVSLTGPTSSTTVNGRKKRQASLSEALFNQLSPLINNEQVLFTFKGLINSLAKYSAHQT